VTARNGGHTRPVMNVVVISLWRNDGHRHLLRRILHLLSKAHHYPSTRFVWVVGDSTDDTEQQLAVFANANANVTLRRHDTSIAGGRDHAQRLRCLSETANAALDEVDCRDDMVVIHESDLVSPPDVLARLVAHARAGREVTAGWPLLHVNGERLFYDTWAYRAAGLPFMNRPPYHEAYRPDAPFQVDSVGSVWSMPAWAVTSGPAGRALRCHEHACLDLCAGLRARGCAVWVDPALEVIQPTDLWTPW
jgi:hypothetical protein